MHCSSESYYEKLHCCITPCMRNPTVVKFLTKLTAVWNQLWLCVVRIEVQNVDCKCTKSDISKAFRPFGPIGTLFYNNQRAYAHIKYTVPDAARLAIQRMNLVPLCGCCLSVSTYLLSIFTMPHSGDG